MSSGDFSAVFTGEACNAPDVTAPESNQLILDCTSRDTDNSVSDYVTVTCGSGDGAESDIYFCFDGTGYRDGGSSDDTELYDQTTLDCVIDGSDNGSIGEEETVVS
ncbi:MAG: hypothetical protein H7A33_01595 [Deltaproteobacteria bacterium]|nr:hypothetical protein [Deltaproteobacteria bacterium]